MSLCSLTDIWGPVTDRMNHCRGRNPSTAVIWGKREPLRGSNEWECGVVCDASLVMSVEKCECASSSAALSGTAHKFAVSLDTSLWRSTQTHSPVTFEFRRSSVVTATRCELEGPGIESRCERDCPHPSRPALGPTQLPTQGIVSLLVDQAATSARI